MEMYVIALSIVAYFLFDKLIVSRIQKDNQHDVELMKSKLDEALITEHDLGQRLNRILDKDAVSCHGEVG